MRPRTDGAPPGWPTPERVAEELFSARLVAGATGIRTARLLAVRPWSVVFAVSLDGEGLGVEVVVKCLHEPHDRTPRTDESTIRRCELEIKTLEVAEKHGVTMPRPVGVLPALGATVMQRVPHRTLRNSRHKQHEVLWAVGAMCRRWNSIDDTVDTDECLPVGVVFERLDAMVDRLADEGVWPLSAREWKAVAAEFDHQRDEILAPTHGDLHSGNVWLDGRGTPLFADGVITLAHPVADVARLAAALRTSVIGRNPARPATTRAEVQALLSGYGAHNQAMFTLYLLDAIVERWSGLRRANANRLVRMPTLIVDRVFAGVVRDVIDDQRRRSHHSA